MSILQQIIQEATAAQGDVARMLRLCLVLAARLNHPPLREWVNNELNGYSPEAVLPSYRKLKGLHRGEFVTSAYQTTLDISLQGLPDDICEMLATAPLTGPVAEYIDLAQRASSGNILKMPWPVEIAVKFGTAQVTHGRCTAAWTQISPSDIVALLDQIKTRVLGFALDIESESPNAGDIPGVPSGVAPEKVSHSFITNIMGNIGIMQTGDTTTASISS